MNGTHLRLRLDSDIPTIRSEIKTWRKGRQLVLCYLDTPMILLTVSLQTSERRLVLTERGYRTARQSKHPENRHRPKSQQHMQVYSSNLLLRSSLLASDVGYYHASIS
jgi:hypothetical protein